MNTLTISREQTAGTMVGSSDRPIYAVVGFDGSASSLRALDTAARLLNDRPGGMEIVYVAHLPAVAAAGLVGAASADMQQSFDDTTRELSERSPRPPAGLAPARRRPALALPAPRRRDRGQPDRGGGRPALLGTGPTPRCSSSSAAPSTDTTTSSARSRPPWSGTSTTR